ncbi:MAG: CRISPR-associated DxTHG motif protein [Sulfurimonas sp.]|nr:CRISPR-associated DxTHG motif protein [Sulfurimonas sp.]
MKKAVITFLGKAGVRYDNDAKSYVIADKAIYSIDEKLEVDLKTNKFHNTFPLFIEYSKSNDFDLVALHTRESKEAQEIVLKNEKLAYTFDKDCCIEDNNNNKEIFSIINKNIAKYNEIIFDVSHGFRSLPILAIINLIVENTLFPEKIKHILFAQEEVMYKEYKLIDLKEYLDIANISTVLTTFISTLKVPEIVSSYKLYSLLKEFSIHLTSNQFSTIFSDDIPMLRQEINEKREELFFIKSLLEKLELFLTDIEDIKEKEDYEKFLFFSKLFLDKQYFLHASAYMIEGLTYYCGYALNRVKLIDLDLKEYANQQIVVSFMKMQKNSKEIQYPNIYFMDINSKEIAKFTNLRNTIADIRHNLAHINTQKKYSELDDELKCALKEFHRLVNSEVLENLNYSEDKKIYTVTYKIEKIEKHLKRYFYPNSSIPKFETVWDRYEADELGKLNPEDMSGLKEFIQSKEPELKELHRCISQNIYYIEPIQIKKSFPEPVVKKKTKKPKVKIVQTKQDRESLGKLGESLLEKFPRS